MAEFWENLKAGTDCITEVPKSRWDWKTYQNVTSPSGKQYQNGAVSLTMPTASIPSFQNLTA
ncbi:beta-ketoacyl synthase N-terminal-like domain-containing protein [Bacillus velezensis]|nr:beta-ketoacyl synthase N-terminal-like domain-containing protein [Bacillus velezensis]